MSFSGRDLIKQLIKESNATIAQDIQEALKDLFADTLNEVLK